MLNPARSCLAGVTVLLANVAPLQASPTSARPLLATPDQIEAERVLRTLMEDPEVKALKASLKAGLRQTAIGQTSDGAAHIDNAVDQWTMSLAFKELVTARTTPAILWTTDDTPRTWLGYTLPGVGTSGDNPDFIYRAATVDGAGRYEVSGQFDVGHRAKQFVLQVARLQSADPAPQNQNRADLGNTLATITDKDLDVKPDGRFRITFGGLKPADGATHIALEPGEITIGFRDVLSDWSQRPARLTIRQLDTAASGLLDTARVRAQVLAKLPGYVALWSGFPEKWFGGLQPNTVARPVRREGGWGFLAGIRFQLKPDEAIVVTTDPRSAGYAGFQIVDPWMIASDARRYQTSLNLSQATPNADGTYTYVIAARDPGIANWLDTAGMQEGYGILRFQVLPQDFDGESLMRDFKVIKLAQAATLPGVARANASSRKAALVARANGYSNRTR